MAESKPNKEAAPAKVIHVAPGPHVVSTSLTTRRMMLDVLIGLTPALIVSLVVFQLYAAIQLALAVGSCVAAEAIFTKMRRKPLTLGDFSAVVTGVILAFSLPGTTPAYVTIIAGFVAVGLGKIIFGGVGMNLFNPAMVGRAFVMIAFTAALGATAYVDQSADAADAIGQATPMTAVYTPVKAGLTENVPDGTLMKLLLGNHNGSLGETSALALLIGGLYLCIRKTAAWQIPAGAFVGLGVYAGILNVMNMDTEWTMLHHLLGGAFMLGAFFIITDPVSSPLTPKGRFIFGLIFGVLVMFLRQFSAYPEGVMFSVLLVNAIAPLLNRWTIPTPIGGPVPERK